MDTMEISLVMGVDAQKLHLVGITDMNSVFILKPTFQLFAHEMSIQLSLCY